METVVETLVETLVERVPRISGENRELVEPVYSTAPGECATDTTPPSWGQNRLQESSSPRRREPTSF